jgi:hypothetical protein
MNLWSLDSVGLAALRCGDTVVNAADENPQLLMVKKRLPGPEAQGRPAVRVESSNVQRSLVLFIRQAEEKAVFARLDSGDPMKMPVSPRTSSTQPSALILLTCIDCPIPSPSAPSAESGVVGRT